MISIIIPAYNVEKYIIECVRSIQKQTIKNIEIIIIDDGSIDKTGLICDEMATNDKRIKVIHKSNGGVSSARNIGIKESNGDYLYFMDADDSIKPKMLEILYNSLIIDKLDLTICGYEVISNKNTIKTMDTEYIPDIKKSYSFFRKLVLNNLLNPLWNKLFIKEKIEWFDEEKIRGEDLDFVLKYLRKAKKVKFIKDVLYQYKKREDSSTSICESRRIEDLIDSYNMISSFVISFFNEKSRDEEIYVKNLSLINNFLEYPFYVFNDKEKIIKFYDECFSNEKYVSFVNKNMITKKYMLIRKNAFIHFYIKSFFKKNILNIVKILRKDSK